MSNLSRCTAASGFYFPNGKRTRVSHLCGRSVGQQLVAGQLVLLLHRAAEDLLHAAGDHRQASDNQAQHVVPHLQVRHCPADNKNIHCVG